MADQRRCVTSGVDTHIDTHHAAVLDEQGRLLATAEFPATGRGYRANRCASFTFVTDSDQVARWLDTVHKFLVQYGVS